jgi:hypothetical protein
VRSDRSHVWLQPERGVQQGDVLGPLFFCLGLDKVMEHAKKKLAALSPPVQVDVNVAFIDDIFLGGDPTALEVTATAIDDSAQELCSGLSFNADKTKIYPETGQAFKVFSNPESRWWQAERRPVSAGIVALGAALGSDAFVREHWGKVTESASTLFGYLRDMPGLQERLLLLRHCGVARATFMTRSAHPDVTNDAAKQHDDDVYSVLDSILPQGSKSTPEVWMQASLPLREGGLGLTSAARTHDAAFIASFGDAAATLGASNKRELLNRLRGVHPPATATPEAHSAATSTAPSSIHSSIEELLNRLHSKWKVKEHVPAVYEALSAAPRTIDDLLRHDARKAKAGLQRTLVRVQQVIDIDAVKSRSTTSCACITSLAQKGAPAVFVAVPSDEHLRVDNDAMALKVAMTIGCPAIPKHSIKQATLCSAKSCGPAGADPIQHILNCPMGGAPQRRHDAVKEQVFLMCRSAGLCARLEPRDIENDSDERPDIEVLNLKPGMSSFVEVSVTNPVSDAKNITTKTASKPLRAGERRAYEKERKYRHLATTTKSENLQAILETTGAMTRGLRDLIKRVGIIARQRMNDGGVPSSATWAARGFKAYWMQRIAVALANSIECGVRRIDIRVGISPILAKRTAR